MSDKYKEQLDKIVVSDALRAKILSAAEEKIEKKASKSKSSRVYYFRAAAGIAACAAIVLTAAVTVNIGQTGTVSKDEPVNILAQAPKTETNENSDINTVNPHDNNNQTLNTPAPSPEKYNINTEPQNNGIEPKNTDRTEAVTPEAPSDNAEIPNKIPDYTTGDELAAAPSPYDSLSLDEIKEQVGYEFKVPQYIPDGYAMEDAALMFGSLIQISYTAENGEIVYRTERTQEDISGDYSIYEKTEVIEAGGCAVTVKGNGEKYNLAVWNNGDSYAISSSEGLSKDEIVKIAENIKTP